MSASPLQSVEAFDRWLVQQVHAIERPMVSRLNADELEALEERYGPLAPRIAQLAEIELWEQNADVAELNQHSYGYAIQHKSRERFLKLVGADEQRGRTAEATRASTDAELLARLDRVRLVAEHGQIADSAPGDAA